MAETVETVLDTLDRSARGRATLSVDDVVGAFGRRAYGPLVLVIGLLMLSPINWIPGAGIVLATVLTLFLGQSLVRRGPPWIPRRLGGADVDSRRVHQAVAALRPWVRRVALVVRPRLRLFVCPPWRTGAVGVIIATALSMYPLALIPGGAGPPSLVITLFGLALTVEDGLVMVVALGGAGAVLGVTLWALV